MLSKFVMVQFLRMALGRFLSQSIIALVILMDMLHYLMAKPQIAHRKLVLARVTQWLTGRLATLTAHIR